jgi:hypothetical protein
MIKALLTSGRAAVYFQRRYGVFVVAPFRFEIAPLPSPSPLFLARLNGICLNNK